MTYGAAAVGGLLLQFRQYHRWFLAEYFDQEGLRVQCLNTPRRNVFWPEVAKVESQDYGRFAVGRSREHVTILFVVRHLKNQGLVAADPCLTEMSTQLSFEGSGQRTGPLKLELERTGGLPNDFP